MDRAFESLQDEIAGLVSGLSVARMHQRPTSNMYAWSLAEVLEHLALSYQQTSDVLDARLLRGRPPSRKPAIRERLAQLVVVRLGRFPAGVPAPEIVTPTGETLPAGGGMELSKALRLEMAKMDEMLERAQSKLGKGKIATHFALGPLSANQWRRFHWVHGRHHVGQIRRTIEQTAVKPELSKIAAD